MGKPMLITVNGMGAPDPYAEGLTFAGDLGRAVSDPWNDILAQFRGPQVANKFFWCPIGYSALPFPMGPSVREGIENTVNSVLTREREGINVRGNPLSLTGYSEGALVINTVWRDEIIKPTGRLHHRLGDVEERGAVILFGDPMRCPGMARGNQYAGFDIPGKVNGVTSGGIAGPNDLKPEETPEFVLSCSNLGDLYAAAPVGDNPWVQETPIGHDETLIFNLVQDFDGKNLMAFVTEMAKILGVVLTGGLTITSMLGMITSAIAGAISPAGGIPGITNAPITTPNALVAVVGALLNGGMFILQGLQPHGDHAKHVPAMVDFLLTRLG